MKIILTVLFFFVFITDAFCPSIILPLYPRIASYLHVTRVELHESMAFILAGIFLSQLFIGLNSHKLGYRNSFILLFVMLCIGCFISLNAHTIHVFFLGELIQGVGIGAAFPMIQGVLNIYLKEGLRAELGYIGSFCQFGYFLAPILGASFIYSWHHVFYILLGMAAIMLMLSYFVPRETQKKSRSLQLSNEARLLFNNVPFLYYILINAIANIGFYLFLAWAPFLLMSDLHLSHYQFSLSMFFPTLALFAGGATAALLNERPNTALNIGGFLFFIAGLCLVLFFILKIFTVWSILLCGTIFFLGIGIVQVYSTLAIFLVIDEKLSATAMAAMSLTLNIISALMVFILAHVSIDDKLLLGISFLMVGILILLLMRRLNNLPSIDNNK